MRLIPQELLGDRPFRLDQHFRQTRAGVQAPKGWGETQPATQAAFWLVSRACYAVRFLDLVNVPAARRDAAIRLATAAWAPYAETAHYVIPNDEGIVLCAWDARDVAARLVDTGLTSGQVTIVPEAAFRDAPDASVGTLGRLEKTLDGVLGTVTFGKRKAAEQWWPEIPSVDQWRNFLRGAGLEVSTIEAVPTCEEATWSRGPIGYVPGIRPDTASTGERLAVWISAVAFAVPTIWYVNDLRQVEALKGEAEARLAATEKDLEAVLNSRETALGLQDRASKLADLVSPIDPIQLFSVINELLEQNRSKTPLQLGEWELRGNALKFTVVAPEGNLPPATTLVKAFEKVATFRDVEAKLDGARISVSLRITSTPGITAEPSPRATAAAGGKS